jgi:hypothetical protein
LTLRDLHCYLSLKENILRYLLLTYYTQANGKIDEAMTISNSIRTKDWQTVNVILDFKECKVLKASMYDTTIPKDWERIVGYYYQFYTSTFERLLEENGHPIDIKAEPAN